MKNETFQERKMRTAMVAIQLLAESGTTEDLQALARIGNYAAMKRTETQDAIATTIRSQKLVRPGIHGDRSEATTPVENTDVP